MEAIDYIRKIKCVSAKDSIVGMKLDIQQVIRLMDGFHRELVKESDSLPCVRANSNLHDKNQVELKVGDRFTYRKHEGYSLDDFTGEVVFENGAFGYRIIEGDVYQYFTAFCEHDELKEDILNHVEIIK